MKERPLVVQLDQDPGLLEVSARMAAPLGVDYRKDITSTQIMDADLLIVNSKHLQLAREARAMDYKGRILLFTGDAGIPYSDYRRHEVDEILHKPARIEEFQAVVGKHVAPRPRILCVDDDRDIREMLAEGFNNAGYDTILAENAEQALLKITAAHVILSDIQQPNSQGGYWLLEQARARYSPEQLPFILTTASKFDHAISDRHGAMALSKPFEKEVLEALVRSAVPGRFRHAKPTNILCNIYDANNYLLVQGVLTEAGYNCVHTITSREAEPHVAQADCIISDVSNGGEELLAYTKAHKPGTPFVLIDGGARYETPPEGSVVLAKPFRLSQLDELMARLMAEHLKPKKQQ